MRADGLLEAEPSLVALREEFAVTKSCVYLNNAYVGPLPRTAFSAMSDFLSRWHAGPPDGSRYAGWTAGVSVARERAAQLLGCGSDEVVFSRSTSDGLGMAARSLLREGDEVLIGGLEHPAMYAMWFQLRRRGIRVTVVPHRDGRMRVEDLIATVTAKTRAIGLSLVNTYNGQRVPIEDLADFARARSIHLLVDGIQALGCVDVRPVLSFFSAFSAGAYKWLCSPHGVAITYFNRAAFADAPPIESWYMRARLENYADWNAYLQHILVERNALVPEPQVVPIDPIGQFEPSPDFLSLCGLAGSLDLFLRLGPVRVEQGVVALTEYLRERMQSAGAGVEAPVEMRERSGIVAIRVPDAERFARLAEARGIHLLAQWDVQGRSSRIIRVSPHVYNTTEDIDVLAEFVSSYLSQAHEG